jgi:hypothetical protein
MVAACSPAAGSSPAPTRRRSWRRAPPSSSRCATPCPGYVAVARAGRLG